MHEEIKSILEDLKVDGKKIPVEHKRYEGTAKTFVTWTIIDERPSFVADDEDIYDVVQIDVDIYSTGNYIAIKKEIKKRFKNHLWNFESVSEEMYEDDTKMFHITITFNKEKEAD